MNLNGMTITGNYLNEYLVKGTIREYRMRYNELVYYVDLFKPITVYSGVRNSVILKTSEVLSIG